MVLNVPRKMQERSCFVHVGELRSYEVRTLTWTVVRVDRPKTEILGGILNRTTRRKRWHQASQPFEQSQRTRRFYKNLGYSQSSLVRGTEEGLIWWRDRTSTTRQIYSSNLI